MSGGLSVRPAHKTYTVTKKITNATMLFLKNNGWQFCNKVMIYGYNNFFIILAISPV